MVRGLEFIFLVLQTASQDFVEYFAQELNGWELLAGIYESMTENYV